jgi:beta-N-acetylhexosaminidase
MFGHRHASAIIARIAGVNRRWVGLVRLVGLVGLGGTLLAHQAALAPALDKAAEKWVDTTLKAMTLDEKIGQLIVTSAESTYLSTDSDEFDKLAKKVSELHVGGIHLFGGTERTTSAVLANASGAVILGQPLAAASLVNRLQALSKIPMLNTADFEAGVGFRIHGATLFPRAMAFGAAGDEQLAFEAARITAIESRALGLHVDFSPIADVNNNPRNPVINTRSFGESPEAVGKLASAYIRGMHAGGMMATLKHFPGHGDTDVDSHIGLPIINSPRERLDQIELPPFKAGLAAGADAVMTAHIVLPALDAGPFSPSSLSEPIITNLLRGEMKFDGLVYTDSMGMDAVSKALTPGDAAARAIKAGNDVILHSPDDAAAFAGIKAAVEAGQIPVARIDASVKRILAAKARLGLHQKKLVALDEVPKLVGGRANAAIARNVSAKSITLIKDARNSVPLTIPKTSSILYLSVLDYPTGWRIATPSRTFIPELRQRFPSVTAVEISDRTTTDELDLIRTSAGRYDAIVVSLFVRASSGSGRMDLAPQVGKLLTDIARSTNTSGKPMITTFFGNPYVTLFLKDLPAMLLTYDFYDGAEAAAVRAIVGEAPITGKLPITLPDFFEMGFGLIR